jgi:cyanophycinase-like exopeptidase
MPRVIVAIGGGEIRTRGTAPIDRETIRLAKKEIPNFLFIPTASSDSDRYCEGGDCINALGMAGTSVFVAIDSFGESEEANGAKAIKQLKEAPAVVNFLRNELLAQAKDPALRDAIDNLFRAGARLGDGSSMAALRVEVQTGAERRHWQKLIDRRKQLLRIYRSGRLGSSDRLITSKLAYSDTRRPIDEASDIVLKGVVDFA